MMKGTKTLIKKAQVLKISLLMLCMSILPYIVFAQAGFDADMGDGGDVQDTPINGGVAFLLIAGVTFGAYRLYIARKNKLAKLQPATI